MTTVTGTDDGEYLYDPAGNQSDFVDALGGDDYILMADDDGQDAVDGGSGFDLISYELFTFGSVGVIIDIAAGTGVDGFDNVDSFSNIEDAAGSDFGDELWGDFVGNYLYGLDGGDLLVGFGGDDALYGGAGNDDLYGEDGADLIDGGAGFDFAGYFYSTGGVYVSLAAGVAAGGQATGDVLVGIEDLGGSLYNDTLIGNTGANYLYGYAGNDTLDGGAAGDKLYGGAGNDLYIVDSAIDTVDELSGNGIDRVLSSVSFRLVPSAFVLGYVEQLTLTGGANIRGTGNRLANVIVGNTGSNYLFGDAGNDVLKGAGGIDRLYGGLGVDTLTGGAQRDYFVFNTRPNSYSNRDKITDFVHGTDKIWLDNAILTKVGPNGALKADAFHAGSAAADASDHVIYNKATGVLSYDSNGNAAGGVVQLALLTKKPTLTASDFAVI